MKILKFLLFLILNALLTLVWLMHAGDDFNSAIRLPAIWVFPILLVLLGQITSLCIAIIFCFIEFLLDWQHDKQFGNMEWNRANKDKTFYPEDTTYQIRAFDALEKNFANKNSFRITDFISDNHDTIINGVSTQMHISWFGYFKSSNPNLLLCAKYRTYNDTIENDYYGEAAATSQDFMTRKNRNDSLLKFANRIISRFK